MGATANLTLLADAISSAKSFVWAFAAVYTFIIFAYILSSWVRMPYSPWLNRIQRFLYDVIGAVPAAVPAHPAVDGPARSLADGGDDRAVDPRRGAHADPRPVPLEGRSIDGTHSS